MEAFRLGVSARRRHGDLLCAAHQQGVAHAACEAASLSAAWLPLAALGVLPRCVVGRIYALYARFPVMDELAIA